MTDEQIINALKKYIECAEGTQIARDVGGTLVISLLQNALDLINRQQKENKELKKEKYRLQKAVNQATDYIDKAKAELNRMQDELTRLGRERYNVVPYEDFKAAILKEFISRFILARKNEMRTEIDRDGYPTVEYPPNSIERCLDKALKEMVGGQE